MGSTRTAPGLDVFGEHLVGHLVLLLKGLFRELHESGSR